MIEFLPTEDRVIIQPDKVEEVRDSGIILPQDAVAKAKEEGRMGTVIAVGPGKWSEDGSRRLPMEYKIGDRLFYSKYGQTPIELDGREYTAMRAVDVIARLVEVE